MKERAWQELDVIFVTADAYCDHPSFGVAILSRLLESEGFRVGIIAQPDWQRSEDFLKLGVPKLFFGITAGNLDSMLNIYTSYMNLRKEDKYSPGGMAGLRPKLPTIVYTNKIRELFGSIPIVVGGIEASMRRLAYYDFWSDKVRKSILLDSKADILVYGMGERPVAEIAKRLKAGESIAQMNDIRGTVIARKDVSFLKDCLLLPSFEEVSSDQHKFLEAFKTYSKQLHPPTAKPVAQKTGERFCIQLPPALPLDQQEMDRIYGLRFMRRAHPAYDKFGGVPALKTVETSIISHRGCAASCSFCSLTLHQGRVIQSRSLDSIVQEAREIAADKDFKGVISDIGGPTANMYAARCALDNKCQKQDCLWPDICPHYQSNEKEQLRMLEAVRSLKKIKKINIQSGVRYDLLLRPQAKEYLHALCRHYVSGQLKVAPEHVSERVLRLMHKPNLSVYERFLQAYQRFNKELGKKQYLIPYFITAHPGCTDKEAKELAAFIRRSGFTPEQIQDFIPLPMTRSSCMYYTGRDPETGGVLYVAKKKSDRMRQRVMIQCPPRKERKPVF